jgi:putative chitinase
MLISEHVLHNLCPYAKPEILKGVVESFEKLAPQFGVTTDLRICHFFAQAAVETDWFKTLQEYASGRDYEGRTDLGNTQPGDGVKYKGRGIFQTTGRANYTATGVKMSLDLVNHPELLLEPKNAVISALIYWQSRKMNALADTDDIYACTRAVNGGYNGLNERKRALEVLKSTIGGTFVGPNSSIAEVENVQIMLKILGYRVGVVDGLYGPATAAAVKMFQGDNGLRQTGFVEDSTLKLLEQKTNEKKKE